MACRPSLALLLRPLLLVLPALWLSTACGKGTPKYERKTADEWADLLWSGHGDTVMKASEALVTFSDTNPAVVVAALERQLRRTPPTPEGVAFVISLDPVEARRLGLLARPATDVLAKQLGHVRKRVEAGGDAPASIRGTSDGQVELILDGQRTREQAERVQRRLATRGALDLRVVAEDPATATDRARATAYDGTVPYATRVETEARRLAAALEAGAPYLPEDARWRVAPRGAAVAGAAAPRDLLLLHEPAAGAPVVDESWFSSSRPETASDGTPGLRLAVRVEKARAWADFVRSNAGGRFAAVVDGRVRAEFPVPDAPGPDLWIPIPRGDVPAAAHLEALSDLSIALSSGRLPWPMTTQPLPKEYGRDPPPSNPIAKTIAVVGAPAVPALERVRDGDGPAWGKASAVWALEQIGLIEGQGSTPPK